MRGMDDALGVLLPRNKALLFVGLMTHDNSKKFLRRNNLLCTGWLNRILSEIVFRLAFENLGKIYFELT